MQQQMSALHPVPVIQTTITYEMRQNGPTPPKPAQLGSKNATAPD